MSKNPYRIKNGKELEIGYTTGSCAAAASAAASEMLLTGNAVREVSILLPDEQSVWFEVLDANLREGCASCAIRKNGGDDPDATHGLLVYAQVSIPNGIPEDAVDLGTICLRGGEGVGRVTKKGLQCAVGEPAINPVPRKMIVKSIARVAERLREDVPKLLVEISVPGGEEVARKTFNPRLGIIGGISILGTTGIVEPMSEKALIDTIHVDVDRKYAEDPESILITPGNYGRTFLKEELGIDIDQSAQISNYVGEALDYIKYKGFRHILFVGHAGKLIKVAAGVMNTHSAYADARMEVMASHAAALGAAPETVEKVLSCLTTDEAFAILQEEAYFEDWKERIVRKAMDHLNFRLKGEVHIELVMFTTGRNHILKSEGADALLALWQSR